MSPRGAGIQVPGGPGKQARADHCEGLALLTFLTLSLGPERRPVRARWQRLLGMAVVEIPEFAMDLFGVGVVQLVEGLQGLLPGVPGGLNVA